MTLWQLVFEAARSEKEYHDEVESDELHRLDTQDRSWLQRLLLLLSFTFSRGCFYARL